MKVLQSMQGHKLTALRDETDGAEDESDGAAKAARAFKRTPTATDSQRKKRAARLFMHSLTEQERAEEKQNLKGNL